MTPVVDHHAAQRAIVRMLYDPAFAARVRRDPERSGLPLPVARMVAGIDPRALAADPQRRRRTLGALVEELRASSVIALAEGSLALLEGFFGAPAFHQAIEAEAPLVLALADYLAGLCRDGTLRSPHLPEVLALEAMQARARREAGPVPAREPGRVPARVQLAPGVRYRRCAGQVLDAVRSVEQLLFELSLLPGLALAADAPSLALPPWEPDAPPLPLLCVPLPSGLSLVTLDDELCALVEPLAEAGALPVAALPVAALVERAVARGLPLPRAEALLVELLDDEVVCEAPPAG